MSNENAVNKLLSVSDAQEILLSHFSPLGSENVAIDQALHRVLYQPVKALIDMPPFDNSSMDGFALRGDDLLNASKITPVKLTVIADIAAGSEPDILVKPGEAARIVTGAMIPKGADAVVPVEETNLRIMEPGSAPPQVVEVYSEVMKGDNVRNSGEDFKKDEVLVISNKRLKAQDIGVIAMQGIRTVKMYKRPKVGILSTGDELLEPGYTWSPGKIFDSNTYTLGALCHQSECTIVNLGITRDNEKSITYSFDKAVERRVDLILTSAGVSMGAYDYVRSLLEKEGDLGFWRVNMRPGKPLMFGSYKGIPVIGLPGNPVSAYVGFVVFVKLVLERLSGMLATRRSSAIARLVEPVESDGRESYLRAIVYKDKEGWEAKLTGHQGSGNLLSLVKANALVIIPAGTQFLPVGAQVVFWFLD